jgi:hypothetical protein
MCKFLFPRGAHTFGCSFRGCFTLSSCGTLARFGCGFVRRCSLVRVADEDRGAAVDDVVLLLTPVVLLLTTPAALLMQLPMAPWCR